MFILIINSGSEIYFNVNQILSFHVLANDDVFIKFVDGKSIVHQGGSQSFFEQLKPLNLKEI